MLEKPLTRLFAEFQSDSRINVTAIGTGRVRQLGLITFLANRIIHSLETVMAPAAPGLALAGLLYR